MKIKSQNTKKETQPCLQPAAKQTAAPTIT